MKITHFQIVKKQDMFVLEAIIPPYYGFQVVCQGENFFHAKGSSIIAMQTGETFALFALVEGELLVGPKDVVDYKDHVNTFIFQKEEAGEWYEKDFAGHKELCLGHEAGNFFVLMGTRERVDHVFMYDREGNRTRFECLDWERMGNCNAFLMKNGLYDIYREDTDFPEKVEGHNLALEDLEDKGVRFRWLKDKKAYERLE